MEAHQRQTLLAYLVNSEVLYSKFRERWTDLVNKNMQVGVPRDKQVKITKYSPDMVPFAMLVFVIDNALTVLNRLPLLGEYRTYSENLLAWSQSEFNARTVGDIVPFETLYREAQREFNAALELALLWQQTGVAIDETAATKLMADMFIHQHSRLMKLKLDSAVDKSEIAQEFIKDSVNIRGSLVFRFEEQFPGGYFQPVPDDYFQPIGIKFIDNLLGGGLVKGETVGHAAPINQGKTTLAYQVCCTRVDQILDHFCTKYYGDTPLAKVEDEILMRNDLPQVYFVVYENVQTIKANVISCAASIERNRARQASMRAHDRNFLSSRENLAYQEYERKAFPELFRGYDRDNPNSIRPFGEYERMMRAVKRIEKMLRFVDFSGHTADLMGLASKGTSGIHEYIDAHQRYLSDPGANFIVIDFVGAAVDLMARSKSINQRDRGQYIRTFALEAQLDIAAKFNVPVWLAHQLNPDENKKGAGTVPEVNNAEGSGQFTMYCSIGFASGMLSQDNVAVFKMGKQRRQQASAMDLQLAYLSKVFARWEDAENFKISDNRVVSSDELFSGSNIPSAAGRRNMR